VAPNSEDEWAAFQQSVQGDIEAIDKQVEDDEVRSLVSQRKGRVGGVPAVSVGGHRGGRGSSL
jgi:hypothetical protein